MNLWQSIAAGCKILEFSTSDTVYIKDSKTFASLMQCYIRWLGAEIKCRVQVALPKRHVNQFKRDQKSRQQALRAYFPNVYNVTSDEFPLQESDNRQLYSQYKITVCNFASISLIDLNKVQIAVIIALFQRKFCKCLITWP